MSDIVERLRASIHFKAYAGDAHEQIICGQQMREAAAEIERLRQRLTEAEIACDSWKREAELNQQAADEAAGYAHRLAEAEALLQEVYDGRQSLMSIGLVYRIGHTLNHRLADSASATEP